MSGKSRTGQRQRRPASLGAGGQAGRSGEEQPTARNDGRPVSSRKAMLAERRAKLAAEEQAELRAARRRRLAVRWGVPLVAAAMVGGLFAIYSAASHSGGKTSAYPYQVGSPGPGRSAPAFTLAASTGGTVSLSQYRGKTVLLFFQEGLSCQPCWNQIADMEKHTAQLSAAGISQVISITTDPIGPIIRKTSDMGLTTPVLSDPGLAVSKAYGANLYGMMGMSADGHTFILVGPDGVIRWRADYGGAPKYTMFLPTTTMLADMKSGEHPS